MLDSVRQTKNPCLFVNHTYTIINVNQNNSFITNYSIVTALELIESYYLPVSLPSQFSLLYLSESLDAKVYCDTDESMLS